MKNRKLFGLRKHALSLLLLIYMLSNTGYAQCDANFSFTVDSLTGKVHFTNFSTIRDTLTPVFFMWYSSPAVPLSSDTNPVIHFTPGVHTICLKVSNGSCSDSICKEFTMPPVYCKAEFTYTVDQTSGNVSFSNHSAGANLSYYWSFGDGGYSGQADPAHVYTTNGWHYVCLNTINADSSCQNVVCEFVRVNKSSPTPCHADFIYQHDSTDLHRVHFYNATVGDTGTTYLWILERGTSTVEDPTYLFSDTGTYTVCLLASGPNCADSVCKVVEISNPPPACSAAFTYTLYADSGENNSRRIAVFSNGSAGNALSYIWTFGDSTSETTGEPIHYYPADGTYKVCLIAYNLTNACRDSVCSMISIISITGLASVDFALQQVILYPVPFTDLLNIDFNASEHTQVDITLYDMIGRARHTERKKTDPGENHLEMNTGGLDRGVYFLELRSGDKSKTIRVIK